VNPLPILEIVGDQNWSQTEGRISTAKES
jgi:hypothetical protein